MASRRLTAILAADIAGYSALMGTDEVATVGDLKGHQSVILPLITGYDGRVIDTAGDGILAEFASVLNAVKCAVAIQETMVERNASLPPDRRMHFRIGINQGDVMADDNRIYGDGINVAARLEGICEPGGICISGKVYDEIKGRFEIQYDNLGEQSLKNIAEPVRTYRIRPGFAAKGKRKAFDRPVRLLSRLNVALAAAAVVLIAAAGIGVALIGPWRQSPSVAALSTAPQTTALSSPRAGTAATTPAAVGSSASQTSASAASPLGPFDGTWEVYQVGGEHCMVKTNRYRVVIRNNIVLASRPEPGRVRPDGQFTFTFPSLMDPTVTTNYAGTLTEDTGVGAYQARRCEGKIELKRVEK